MRRLALVFYTALACACIGSVVGCQTSAPKPPVAQLNTCPPLKTYTQAEGAAAQQALMALPPDNPLIQYIADYKAMRDADRACIAGE